MNGILTNFSAKFQRFLFFFFFVKIGKNGDFDPAFKA
ncbi:hypothetical protein HPGAM_06925 [Helicobacter pylori Gambia94/24]|nr:hypothetical protein HPGAM_06925 [Helicobacter pylori Gambia94/24]